MDIEIKHKFDAYPEKAKARLVTVRKLIFEVADELNLGEISESLKWNEPSYVSATGSPIRIDWKTRNPNQISIYFNCQTTLVETFKEVHRDTFQFVGNREIVLPLAQDIPVAAIKSCISMALRYHQIKHLPLLGA